MSAGTTSAFSRFTADIAARWAKAKPLLLALGVGLVAGPVISGMIGFQVRSSTALAMARDGVVEQQAMFCAQRARADTPETAGLDWSARNTLARRFSTMLPDGTTPDPAVVRACVDRLAG